ncbi:MAG: septum formation inhibitor Maf [Solobacterium sp.]|nr:septum formation inhibitor Maf [Solobacterium sp.]
MKKLILASQSPRRNELMEKCSLHFTVEATDIDETIECTEDLQEAVMRLAYGKAHAVLQKHPDAVVVGSDTIVVVDDEVLGKPKDEADAVSMLRKLSGRTHLVMTGLCIISSAREYRNVSVSEVAFETMDEEEISSYVRTGEPMDKAGAYAVQGIAARYIKEIRGDYYAIMGLPLSMVYEALKDRTWYEED